MQSFLADHGQLPHYSSALSTYRSFAWGDNARLLVFTEDCVVLLSSLHVVRQQHECQVQTWLFVSVLQLPELPAADQH